MIDSFFNALPEYLESIMGFLPVLILIAIPIAIFVARRKTQNETELAKATADLLGLRYINVAEEMKEKKKENATLLNLLSGWSTWAMEGLYKGIKVRVELIVKSNQQRYIARSDQVAVSNPTRTSYSRGIVYIACFETPLPFDITIHKTIKLPFGFPQLQQSQKVETGDEKLDQLITIKGSDKDKIQAWLHSNQRIELIKNLYQALPTVLISNDNIQAREPDNKAVHDRLKRNLALICDAVLKLKTD